MVLDCATETHREGLGGVDAFGAAPALCGPRPAFSISRVVQRQGVRRQFIEAAIVHVRAQVARIIGAYPVARNHPATASWGSSGERGHVVPRSGIAGSLRSVMHTTSGRELGTLKHSRNLHMERQLSEFSKRGACCQILFMSILIPAAFSSLAT